MALILNIDTSNESATVSIAEDGKILNSLENPNQKDHASFLHLAVIEILNKSGLTLKNLSAIAVTAGPGSYTGIRVGIASAKGFCLALDCPLIMINSLELLALAAIQNAVSAGYLYAPMIDARRMEVYCAVYDQQLKTIEKPIAQVLNETSFNDLLNKNKLVFCGSGAPKFKEICQHENAFFTDKLEIPTSMARYSSLKFDESKFDDLISSEPFYLKDLYVPSRNA